MRSFSDKKEKKENISGYFGHLKKKAAPEADQDERLICYCKKCKPIKENGAICTAIKKGSIPTFQSP